MQTMKKVLTTSCLIIILVFGMNSQAFSQSKFQIEAKADYGTEIESFGLGAGALYSFTPKIDAEANFLYYLGTPDNTTSWEFNLNGHYAFYNKNGTQVYGLAGLNYYSYSVDVDTQAGNFSADGSDIGLNIGAGAEYGLSFGSIFAELKYVLGGAEQLSIGAGVRFGI